VRQVELEIERVARARAHHERAVEFHIYRERECARGSLRALNLDLIGRDAGATGQRKSALRVGRHGEQHIAGIGSDGQHRTGVGSGRHTDVAENLAELIELLEIDIRGRSRRIPHGHRIPSPGRHERDAEHTHTNTGPVIGGGVAHGD